jgi:secreted trypsin-like serine protease
MDSQTINQSVVSHEEGVRGGVGSATIVGSCFPNAWLHVEVMFSAHNHTDISFHVQHLLQCSYKFHAFAAVKSGFVHAYGFTPILTELHDLFDR